MSAILTFINTILYLIVQPPYMSSFWVVPITTWELVTKDTWRLPFNFETTSFASSKCYTENSCVSKFLIVSEIIPLFNVLIIKVLVFSIFFIENNRSWQILNSCWFVCSFQTYKPAVFSRPTKKSDSSIWHMVFTFFPLKYRLIAWSFFALSSPSCPARKICWDYSIAIISLIGDIFCANV